MSSHKAKTLGYDDIDLILMDIKMPVMDGFAAIEKIREVNQDVIIIAQTAYRHSKNLEKATKNGFNDIVIKPLNEEVILSKIRRFF